MAVRDKRRVIFAIIFTGMVLVTMVLMSAFAAELRHENNRLISENEELTGEVETISVRINTYNNVEHIEKAAKKMGMVYPTSKQMVKITEKDAPGANFAAAIRQRAYD